MAVDELGRVCEQLEALVTQESPSNDLDAMSKCVGLADSLGAGWLGSPAELVTVEDRQHLRWSFPGPRKVLVLCHIDTVWPLHTIDRWPFDIVDDRATGPGVFDMKIGVVQAFLALSRLDDLSGVTLLLTTDEEIGSPTSRALIENSARDTVATLVVEPSAAGALKLARKGASFYTANFLGRAAHAGLEPEAGVNAITALSHWALAAGAAADPETGTTVTPTLVAGGSAMNTVPAKASLRVDVRVATLAEQSRVDRDLHAIRIPMPEAGLDLEGGPNRPPLERARSERLFQLAAGIAQQLGQPELRGTEVGGGSDGNFTAGIGIDTLDGLGGVGDHAHAEGEWASVSTVIGRANLVAALIEQLRHTP
jgi:glutamate carboxypeptidase